MSGTKRQGGLGRGLGALIPSAPAGPASAEQAVVARPSGAGGGPADIGIIATDRPRSPVGSPVPDSVPSEPPATSSTDPDSPTDSQPADERADGPAAVPGAYFAELPVTAIQANAKQPRQVFDEDALGELTHSIREFGVLQPVVVRAIEPVDGAERYELVMGERRLRASQEAGLDMIPAIVRETGDDDMLRDALLENIHRAALNPLEEAAAYQQLLEEFGATHDELARRIGRSRSQVSNTIRLMNLPVPVQRRVAAGVLSAGHARALLGLEDPEAAEVLAMRIVAEGLSVRATEEAVTLAARTSEAKPGRRAPSRTFTAPAVTNLAERLSDTFDTRVKVDIGRRKGRITVEFATIDDLERIVALMAPGIGSRPDADGATAAVVGSAPDQPPNEP